MYKSPQPFDWFSHLKAFLWTESVIGAKINVVQSSQHQEKVTPNITFQSKNAKMSLLFFRILMCVHAEPMDSQVLETNPISDWPSLSKCSHWCYPGYKIRFSSASAHCTTRAYLVWNRGNRHTPIRHGHGALTQMEPETTLELGLGAESEITGHRGGQVTVSVWVEDAW